MASMCMVEMNSSTTSLVKEDIPLLRKAHESNIFTRCCCWFLRRCRREKELQSRTIVIGKVNQEKYPANVIRNQKYSIFTFLPLVLYEQFKFFLNLYFLVMALSQFVPELKLGYLYTYWGPLIFVLMVTLFREAVDDFRRHQRDEEVNSQKYKKIMRTGNNRISEELVASSKLKVGDIIRIEKDQRVPADLLLLRTTETSGTCFVRTDQLDGETDWKLRRAVPLTQKLDSDQDMLDIYFSIFAEKPQKDIHTFIGTIRAEGADQKDNGLNVESTLWANCVVASGTAVGVVMYTGAETRSVMNNSQPRSKVGLLDLEINRLTKVLFGAVITLAFVMMCLKGFNGPWHRYMFRFVLLFSYIIPISLRVNLDIGKAFYSWMMQRDKEMPGTVVRSTTIPEELGRISYLFTDKTGTLTQNDMVFKRLHLGNTSYTHDSFDQVRQQLKCIYNSGDAGPSHAGASAKLPGAGKIRRSEFTRLLEAVKAISLCHNVTPVYDEDSNTSPTSAIKEIDNEEKFFDFIKDKEPSYQASSPDEIALVKWSELVGLTVVKRTPSMIYLKSPHDDFIKYSILQLFPFTSETKRMGIILREEKTGQIIFYLKGADVVMKEIVAYNNWMEEECGNMAREGLRTLVVARTILTEEQYQEFETKIEMARSFVEDRDARVTAEIEKLEKDMELLCVTGVEDKLQDNVRPTLELLRNAGIKVWMLTGDKLETATCIAKSSRLVERTMPCFTFGPVSSRTEAHSELQKFCNLQDAALIISGDVLEAYLGYYKPEFLFAACRSPAVVCCRCSPTQKAEVVSLIRAWKEKRIAAVGDGGNDVSMIQAADCGIGIAGREGRQASLAADFSITQFSHLSRLIVVHGRNSYKRSAALSQFVIHRGLIISTMQAIFSAVFYFSSVSLYQGLLMVGYATIYTMFPVFSLVLDKDVSVCTALLYPELYKDLSKGRSLSFKTFFIWVLVSIYQGGVIMYGAFLLFEDEFMHIVTISFTALILTELIMVALTVHTWHYLIVLAELFSLVVYILSVIIFKNYFDFTFIMTQDFLWRTTLITLVSCLPLYILKFLRKKFSPPSYSKLS